MELRGLQIDNRLWEDPDQINFSRDLTELYQNAWPIISSERVGQIVIFGTAGEIDNKNSFKKLFYGI